MSLMRYIFYCDISQFAYCLLLLNVSVMHVAIGYQVITLKKIKKEKKFLGEK